MLCSLGGGSAMDDLSEARSVTGTGSTGRSAKELDMLFSAAGGPAIDDSSTAVRQNLLQVQEQAALR